MKKFLVAGAAIAALGYASSAMAVSPYPTLSGNNGGSTLALPSLIITIASGGGVTIANNLSVCPSGACPYDGVEDTYIGVVNNSGSAVSSLNLTAPVGTDAFGFDGDGIGIYGAGTNGLDTSDGAYGGGDAYFTNIVVDTTGNHNAGTVNFIGGIAANGGTGYFSLEEPISAATFSGGGITTGGVPEPASWALMLLGFFGMGSLLRRHRQGASALA